MLVDHRAEYARAATAIPSPTPFAAQGQERDVVIERGIAAVLFALAIAIRIGADTAAHGYQPFLERIIQLFG